MHTAQEGRARERKRQGEIINFGGGAHRKSGKKDGITVICAQDSRYCAKYVKTGKQRLNGTKRHKKARPVCPLGSKRNALCKYMLFNYERAKTALI